MTVNVISVGPEDDLSSIAQILTKKRIHGVPVVDKGKVVGIITETDFFAKDESGNYLPTCIAYLKKSKKEKEKDENSKREAEKLLGLKAKDIMTCPCKTALPSMQITEVVDSFKKTGFTTLPVTNEKGELVGIITTADLIKLL